MTKADEKPTSYEVNTVKDSNGDILIPIPPQLLKELGWKAGHDIEIKIDDKGNYILSRGDK